MVIMMRCVLFVCVLSVWCGCGCAATGVETPKPQACVVSETEKCLASGSGASQLGGEGTNLNGNPGVVVPEVPNNLCRKDNGAKSTCEGEPGSQPGSTGPKETCTTSDGAVEGATNCSQSEKDTADKARIQAASDPDTALEGQGELVQDSAGDSSCRTTQDIANNEEKCKGKTPQVVEVGVPGATAGAGGGGGGGTLEERRPNLSPTETEREAPNALSERGDAPGPRNDGDAEGLCKNGERKESGENCKERNNQKNNKPGQQKDELLGKTPQALDINGEDDKPTGAKNNADGSVVSSPAPDSPGTESAADARPHGEPAESTAQAAVEQSDAVQSQTSSASTSTSATEATVSSGQPSSSSPSTDKGQDPKAADSSSGPVWVHAPPLLLLLSVMWLGGLAVTAVC
ncbi:hypothetical protein DQ04_09281010 [Trypanosoma grayi]|uniref:hypothetical protein n=1 Tax=Trypanosoma grayi TaxID=71804 RepID=UPI0004F48608|nr:hypothetical protein DQ04_09281010 [Trypanosoma grayi]KEG07613.1 hypothetical protein DQ04_09281010 [Trypanosoma grayi]